MRPAGSAGYPPKTGNASVALSAREGRVNITRKQLYVYVAMALVVTVFGARYVLGGRAAAAAPPGLLAHGVPVAQRQPDARLGRRRAGGRVRVRRRGAPGRVQARAGVAGRRRAGGSPAAPAVSAELSSINLAAKLTDGQQVVVPKKGAAAPRRRRRRTRRRRRGSPAAGAPAASSTSTRRPRRSSTPCRVSARRRPRRSSTIAPPTEASRGSTS